MAGIAAPNIVKDGLVFYVDAANPRSYPGSGTTVTDLIDTNNGTMSGPSGTNNSPQFDSSNMGCIDFDGTDDRLSIPKEADPSPNPFTAFLWFKDGRQGGHTSFPHLIDNLDRSTQTGWHSTINRWGSNNGTVSFRFVDSATSAAQSFAIYSTTENLDDGNWHMLTCQWDGSTSSDSAKLYIDGKFEVAGTPSYGNVRSRILDIGLGNGNYGNGIKFLGKLGPFIIYNRILSSQEVKQNYNALKGRFGL
jgi:hypothetical protein